MKREEVGIVLIVGTAGAVVEGGARGDDQVRSFELPVDVLERVRRHVGMAQDDPLLPPPPQVG